MNLFFCLEKWWIFASCTSKGIIMTFCVRNLKKVTFSCKKACIFTFIQKKYESLLLCIRTFWIITFFLQIFSFLCEKVKKKKFLIHKSVLHYICILEVQLFWRTVPCKCIYRTCMSLLLFFCRSTWRTGIYSWLMSSASLGLEWCNPGIWIYIIIYV